MSIKRILSCHPIKFLGGGEGYDPVNKKKKLKLKNNGYKKHNSSNFSFSGSNSFIFTIFYSRTCSKNRNYLKKIK